MHGLFAQANHDHDGARRATERLAALNPAWRDDPRGSLARVFADEAIITRLGRDLAAAGLGQT